MTRIWGQSRKCETHLQWTYQCWDLSQDEYSFKFTSWCPIYLWTVHFGLFFLGVLHLFKMLSIRVTPNNTVQIKMHWGFIVNATNVNLCTLVSGRLFDKGKSSHIFHQNTKRMFGKLHTTILLLWRLLRQTSTVEITLSTTVFQASNTMDHWTPFKQPMHSKELKSI